MTLLFVVCILAQTTTDQIVEADDASERLDPFINLIQLFGIGMLYSQLGIDTLRLLEL